MKKKNAEEKPPTRREKRAEIVAAKSGGAADFLRGKTINKKTAISERKKNRKLVVRRRKIGMFFSAMAGLAVIIFIFLLQFMANVEVVDMAGRELGDGYVAAVEKYFEEQPLERMVSQLREGELLASIQREFPEVGEISGVEFAGVAHYKISLKMRSAVAVWSVGQKKIYVDENGVAFEKNYGDEPEISVVDEAIYEVDSGVSVAGGSFVKFIGQLVSAANDSGLTVSEVKIPQDALRYVEVNFEEVAFPVKFSSVKSATGQVNNLKTALEYFNTNGKEPKYLDLRIEGKGYYR